MPLAINLNSLSSRAIRTASSDGGVRRIAVNATASLDKPEGGLAFVYNAVLKFGKSLLSSAWNAIAAFFTIDWAKVWQAIVGGVRFLLNFNINMDNKAIEAQIKQAEIALAAAKGSLVGQSLGKAICGIVPAATIAVFNQPLALYMMKELGEEAADDIAASVANLVKLQIQQGARVGFLALFKNHRSLVRGAAIGFANLLVRVGILTQESVDQANKERNKPWSIASALNTSVESIKDPVDQAYAEELWEELADSCIEAGYIIASSADGYFAQQKMANETVFGTERIIEIQPIRNADEVNT